jgi:hypothetical protein
MSEPEAINLLLDLIPHIHVTSHSPGKMELQVALSGLSAIKGMDVKAFGNSIPGILNVKVKWLSRTVVIYYDPNILSYDLFEHLFQLNEKPDHESPLFAELKHIFQGQ